MHREESTPLGWIRVAVGGIARLVMWGCVAFIVGNAVVWTWDEGAIGLAIAETVFFPLTFLIYPFAAEPSAYAWPLDDGTSFIPFLIAAVVAYPISTFVGGLRPV